MGSLRSQRGRRRQAISSRWKMRSGNEPRSREAELANQSLIQIKVVNNKHKSRLQEVIV